MYPFQFCSYANFWINIFMPKAFSEYLVQWGASVNSRFNLGFVFFTYASCLFSSCNACAFQYCGGFSCNTKLMVYCRQTKIFKTVCAVLWWLAKLPEINHYHVLFSEYQSYNTNCFSGRQEIKSRTITFSISF